MNGKDISRCLVSGALAAVLLGVLWICVDLSSDSLAASGVPAPQHTPLVAPSQVTQTVYLPLVGRHFPACEVPPLFWASDAGGILLRWRWPERCSGGDSFHVYRTDGSGTRVLITDSVSAITDPEEADEVLGPTWDWTTASNTMGVEDLEDLLDLGAGNPMQAMYLARNNYRVALVYGWGYSDTDVTSGAIYTYEAEAVPGVREPTYAITPVVAKAEDETPFPAPTGLTVTAVISEDLMGTTDWAKGQKNRKGDRWIFLRWDASTTETQSAVGPPVTPPILVGYDIYRAGPEGDYEQINDDPIVPMPATRPAADPITLPLELHDYYFKDEDESLDYGETYTYRVAPRDLLGRPLAWGSENEAQFSDPVTATPRDTMPPRTPRDLSAVTYHLDQKNVLTWTAQTTDTAGYRIDWSYHPTASVIASPAVDPEQHWMTLVNIESPAAAIYTDTGALGPLEEDRTYWYRIRAFDEAGNLSAPSEPVFATLRDRVPPDAPDVEVMRDWFAIDVAPDVEEVLAFCSVNGGPSRLWTTLEPEDDEVAFHPQAEYSPAIRSWVTCTFQSVDASGNRSELPGEKGFSYGPSAPPPPAPIIKDVSTSGNEEDGWAAVLVWEAEPAPGVLGFRIYRKVYGSDAPAERVDGTGEVETQPETRLYVDDSVQVGVVYSYTVAVYRPGGFYDPDDEEIHSEPRIYKVVPPLDCCTRPQGEITWRDISTYTVGEGAHLRWTGDPPGDIVRFIVFRSLHEDTGYAQLTPPLTGSSYVDSDAEHDGYWYVVLQLDWTTGEVIGRSAPWSSGSEGGGSAQDSLGQSGGLALVAASKGEPTSVPLARGDETEAAQVIDLTPSDDAYVNLDDPTRNYGSARHMLVARTALGNRRTALVRFGLSSIPAGSVVDRAVLSAYVDDASGNGGIDVTRLDGSWDEKTVTAWTSIPRGPVYATSAAVASSGWVTWDVTALAEEWVRGLHENYGVALEGAGKMAFERSFTTKEGSAALAPTLSISYTRPPERLVFGDGFVIESPTYDQGSTWDCLTGEGPMALGGGPLPVVTYTVPFTCITAVPVLFSPGEGRVTNGSVSVPLVSPLDIDYPEGFDYRISEIGVNKNGGVARITLTLPSDIIVHAGGVPEDPFRFFGAGVTLHPDLTYDFAIDASALPDQSCEVMTPTLYFEMNPLPLRVVPSGTITFTEEHVTFSSACTQYDERFGYARPGGSAPDAADGYLRAVYDSTGPVSIEGGGLYGTFSTEKPMVFGLAVPYGYELGVTGGEFDIEASKITGGELGNGMLSFDYYRRMITNTLISPAPPEGLFTAVFGGLTIGENGAVHGVVTTPLPVSWPATEGFILDEAAYQLYLPPVESEGMPWDAVMGSWREDQRVQPGVNRVTDPGESVGLTWMNCGTGAPVTFPEGVETDMYLRRGGVSDIFTATISPGSGVETELYGYDTTIKGFRLSFCDNYIFDSDVSADLDLPYPSNTIIPLIDVQLNSDTACVESGVVSAEGDPLTLSYWQAVLHPTMVEFRDTDDSAFQGRALWILGGMDVPHLSLLDDEETATIPLETCLTPSGRFHAFNLVHQEAHYTFDGFGMLLSGVRLSRWDRTSPELPEWDEAATLGDPPSTHRGFMELVGTLLTPLFGSLEDEEGNRPKLQFRTNSDFVGFTSRPRVKRGWTAKAGLGFKFDLLYAHAVDGHDARFLAWDQETFLNVDVDALKFFTMDWATVIDPGETGIYFGLSTVPALARSVAEMTISPTVPTTFTEEISQAAQSEWFPALDISETLSVSETQGYLKLTEAIWEELDGPEDVSLALDDYITHGMEISTPMGGGTTGKLKEWGVDFSEVRGQAAFSPVKKDGELVDWHLEELHVSLQFTISWGMTDTKGTSAQYVSIVDPYGLDSGGDGDGNGKDDEKAKGEGKFIRAKRLTFRITRDGEYALVGQRVRTNLTDDVKDIDFALLIATEDNIRVEGGLVLHDYVIQGVKFKYVGAVFGVGEFGEGAYHGDPFFYIGALGEAKFGPSGDEYTAGGAILIGTIYTESYVLREMGFGDLLDRLSDTGEPGDLLIGAYVRVYGDFPIYKSGCMYQLTAGGEVSAWFFAARAGEDFAWGGRLRAYITGKILCVVSARGDLTLEIASGGHPSGTKSYYFDGQFWVAGGVGWCEPGKKWDTWENRWWKDSWCWCCGAMIDADYNLTQPDAWHWNADADYE